MMQFDLFIHCAHFSKFLSDLSNGVHLKVVFGTKKFGSKVIHRQYLNRKTRLKLDP